MKKVLTVFGTRPEAIKLFPLILKLREETSLEHKICVTGQHKEMLDSVLSEFDITPDYNLSVMKESQTLSYLTESILVKINAVLDEYTPDIILVHGDTTTAFTSALAAFYRGIRVGHVEAGLRSNDIFAPFPEEFNRRAISLISSYNFAPTKESVDNLLREGIKKENIYLTGNTAIDTIKHTLKSNVCFDLPHKPFVLMTLHRREHTDAEISEIFGAVRKICIEFANLTVIYPVHKNPRFTLLSKNILGDLPNVILTDPINVKKFHSLLNECLFIMTDSGGIQEEASFLGKHVLILRNNTERPEGITCGNLKVIGTDHERVFNEMKNLIIKAEAPSQLARCDKFGDGRASERIVEILKSI